MKRFETIRCSWKERRRVRSINLYLTEIATLISTHIKSPYGHQTCMLFAVAELVASMDDREKYTDGEASRVWE